MADINPNTASDPGRRRRHTDSDRLTADQIAAGLTRWRDEVRKIADTILATHGEFVTWEKALLNALVKDDDAPALLLAHFYPTRRRADESLFAEVSAARAAAAATAVNTPEDTDAEAQEPTTAADRDVEVQEHRRSRPGYGPTQRPDRSAAAAVDLLFLATFQFAAAPKALAAMTKAEALAYSEQQTLEARFVSLLIAPLNDSDIVGEYYKDKDAEVRAIWKQALASEPRVVV